MHLHIPLKSTRESQSAYPLSDRNNAKTIPFGWHIPIRQLYKGVSPVCKNLHYSASSFELAVKHAVCQDKNMLQVFYKNT